MPFNGEGTIIISAGSVTAPEVSDADVIAAIDQMEAAALAAEQRELGAQAVAAFHDAGYPVAAVNAQNQRREVVSTRDGSVTIEEYMAVDTDEEGPVSQGTSRGDYEVDDSSSLPYEVKRAAGALALSKPTQTIPFLYTEIFRG